MPTVLKTTVDTLDGIPEGFRANYKQDDTTKKYVLQEVAIPDPVDVSGLERKTAQLLNEKKKLEEKFNGIDLEKYNKLVADAAAAEQAALEGKGQWEALKKQLLDGHQAELSKKDQRAQQLQSALEARLVDAEATTAIAAAKGIPTLLLPHVKAHIKVFEEEGEFIAKVVDAKGNPRIGDTKGTPMTIPQLVEEMKASEVFGRAFEASGAGGSGASNGNTTGRNAGKKTMSRKDYDALPIAERAVVFTNNPGMTLTDP